MGGGSYRSTKKTRQKEVRWLGMYLDPSAAQILFILAIFALIGDLIWGLILFIGLIHYLSWSSYVNQAQQQYGMSSAPYQSYIVTWYIIYFVIWLILLIFIIYTISVCKPSRRA